MIESCVNIPGMIVRRPIHDRRSKVLGYFVLAHDPHQSVRTLIDLGIERLSDGKQVFVEHDVDRPLPDLTGLPFERIAVMLLGDDLDPILSMARELTELGIRCGVEQHVFERNHDVLRPSVKFVAINVPGQYDTVLQNKVYALKKHGVRLIALNVDDYPTYNKCVTMGFDYFMGTFITKPMVSGRKQVPISRLALINLMTRLQEPNLTLDEIEHLVAMDAMLGFRLLRLVNSASEGNAERVESLRMAIAMLGTQKIANLVSLLTYQKIDDKPNELTHIALVRAKISEDLAKAMGFSRPEKYFTAGLLSVLDAMFDVPMRELVGQLPLTSEICDALLDAETDDNPVALVLYNVIALESSQFDRVKEVDETILAGAYINALDWADEALAA